MKLKIQTNKLLVPVVATNLAIHVWIKNNIIWSPGKKIKLKIINLEDMVKKYAKSIKLHLLLFWTL